MPCPNGGVKLKKLAGPLGVFAQSLDGKPNKHDQLTATEKWFEVRKTAPLPLHFDPSIKSTKPQQVFDS